MTKKNILKRLNTLYKETPVTDISPEDKTVIFSDLHLGNGGRMDDFAKERKIQVWQPVPIKLGFPLISECFFQAYLCLIFSFKYVKLYGE